MMAEATDARTDVIEMFRAAGLDETFVNQLIAVIDQVYTDNIAPSEADVLTTIYGSEAYKTRFAGNEITRKRMADGMGMPGDMILTPAQYIELEKSEAGLPAGFYDNPADFAGLIGSGISAAEVATRINTAADALQYADTNTINALQTYYGLSQGDLVAYLLDPTKAEGVLANRAKDTASLSKMYGAAKVTGTAALQGVNIGQGFAEEIVSSGKASGAEDAFAAVGDAQGSYKRLGDIYGQVTAGEDLARAALQLEGGVTAKQKIKKLGQKERSAFATQSALSESSLNRAADL
jgi:hypothetical protein